MNVSRRRLSLRNGASYTYNDRNVKLKFHYNVYYIKLIRETKEFSENIKIRLARGTERRCCHLGKFVTSNFVFNLLFYLFVANGMGITVSSRKILT